MRLEKRYPAYRCWATRIWRSSIRTMTTLLKKHLLKLLLLPSPHLLLCQNPKFLSQFPLRYHSTTILDLRCSLLLHLARLIADCLEQSLEKLKPPSTGLEFPTILSLPLIQCTVMIRFSARGPYLLLLPQGRALIRDRALILDRALI